MTAYTAASTTDLTAAGERRQIRRASNAIGAAFLIMTALTTFLSVGTGLLLSYGVHNTALLRDAGFLWMEQVWLSVIGFVLPFGLAAKLMDFRLSDLIVMRRVRASLLLPLVMICMGAFLLGNVATSYLGQIFEGMGVTPTQASIEAPRGVWGTVLYYLSISAVPALVEEFALRGVVMNSLRRFGDGFAIFTSAALFGLMHGNLIPGALCLCGRAGAGVCRRCGRVALAVDSGAPYQQFFRHSGHGRNRHGAGADAGFPLDRIFAFASSGGGDRSAPPSAGEAGGLPPAGIGYGTVGRAENGGVRLHALHDFYTADFCRNHALCSDFLLNTGRFGHVFEEN